MITFDIETIPTEDPAIIAEFAATIKAPGQYKKQDSIDAWMAENRESALTEMVSKTSFDGMYGRVACIAWARDDGDVYSTESDDSEGAAIERFYSSIGPSDSVFCGHNIAGFDLPFLKHRSIILGIKPPKEIRKAMDSKPWGDCVADTLLMWSSDREKRVSMEKLCRALGIAGKGDFDGSQVAETWPVDPWKVIDYCKNDVLRTRAIFKRLTFME